MKIRNSIDKIAEEMTKHRRTLHQNPQTSYEEVFASDLISEKLTAWGIDHERGIAVTGIVATIEGETSTSGKSIGLRADMDALDILEENNKDWVSKTPGKMHGCGHDGHTAMLLGTAKHLSENRNFDGKVHLIFQPAEEGGGGAYKMIEEKLFDRFPCDEVYAMHNWPLLPRGKFATRTGPMMAASDRLDITIHGKSGHAALPQLCVDPIVIGSQIVSMLQTLISRSIDPTQMAVLSITNFNAGTGPYNVIPEKAELSGTLRTLYPDIRADLQKRIIDICKDTAKTMGGSAEIVFDSGGYDPTINTAKSAAFCANVARKVFGDENVDDDIAPFMGAEDFGAMLQQKPGAYVLVGQAEEDASSNHNHGLHTPQYDFNDAIIPLGIEYWVSLVEAALPTSK